ncbi:DHquinase_I domain-containing protein/Shikimate_DH domain-containing protein/Shikimate_dh_N domain-containing protein [Cephalotus follicularis]|uniref:shikimate dehydrogenase (NADP(+)) n=1 Tax=Cephalotus follicularis TaxID=3775 RepID=A0A1Q3B8U8_CEPFO|nr:DHquinase_I domain-containing protein/Shikimate_DH domain-containing protein/Shikimate_dh_N domain-containing protein [Cephalotus follicularis]
MGSLPFTTTDLQTSTSGVKSSPTLLCTPLMGTTVDQMLMEMQKAKDIGADVVEIRLDCLRNFSPRQDLGTLIKQSPLPTLVTYRPIWEGGQYEGDENKRQDALRVAMELGASYIDIELEVAHDFNNSIYGKKPDNFKVIVSSHNFHNTPSAEAIGNLVARIQATGADIVKIATTALDITDCARIFQIMVHSQIPTVGIVMGERGLISRILSPKFGGYLTYGALEAGAISAPGQPTAKDLLDLYNFRLIGADTKFYGIIGKPVGHSKSPLLFNAAFKSVGLNAIYLHFLVDDVEKFFNTYSTPDFGGTSCTIPHKEAALKCMDEIDAIAKKIGAINNIVRRADGKLIAFNTDYIGAISAIEDGLRGLNGATPAAASPLAGKLFVVLGAGGAGKSLAYGAAQKGARVVVANRTFERAKELADKVGGHAMTLEEVENFHPQEGMVLANTTSVGMKPKIDLTPLPKHALKHYCLVFDAIYTPKDTRLLREARDTGAVIVYGTEMLIRQGFEQYKNFTGLPAPEELFRQLMEKHA